MRTPVAPSYKTKADVVAYVKKSFADGAAAIQAKGDKGLNDLIVDPSPTSRPASPTWPTASSNIPANIRPTRRLLSPLRIGPPRVASQEIMRSAAVSAAAVALGVARVGRTLLSDAFGLAFDLPSDLVFPFDLSSGEVENIHVRTAVLGPRPVALDFMF